MGRHIHENPSTIDVLLRKKGSYLKDGLPTCSPASGYLAIRILNVPLFVFNAIETTPPRHFEIGHQLRHVLEKYIPREARL